MRSKGPGTLPLYIGGFLGPFGGGVVAVLVPAVARGVRRDDRGRGGDDPRLPGAVRGAAAGQRARSASGSGAGGWCGPATSSTRSSALSRRSRRTSASFLGDPRAAGQRERVPHAAAARRPGRRGAAAADRAGGRDVRGRADRRGRARAARRRGARRDRLAARVRQPGAWWRSRWRRCRRPTGAAATTSRGCAPCSPAASACSAAPRSRATRA